MIIVCGIDLLHLATSGPAISGLTTDKVTACLERYIALLCRNGTIETELGYIVHCLVHSLLTACKAWVELTTARH